MSIGFTLVGSIPERIRTLEFYRALLELHPFQINGDQSTFVLDDEGDEGQIDHLDYLHKLMKLFDLLDVDSRLIHFDEIDDRQHHDLQYLYEILVEGKEFTRDGAEAGIGSAVGVGDTQHGWSLASLEGCHHAQSVPQRVS